MCLSRAEDTESVSIANTCIRSLYVEPLDSAMMHLNEVFTDVSHRALYFRSLTWFPVCAKLQRLRFKCCQLMWLPGKAVLGSKCCL